MAWDDARVETLTRLWAEGLSGAQIAQQLRGGVTRSAVIAKGWRLGLPERSADIKDANHRAAIRKVAPVNNLAAVNVLRRLCADDPPLPPTKAFQPIAGSSPKPWTDRGFGECCWPVGDEPIQQSCCNPVFQRGWCGVHFKTGTQPAKVRDRVDDRLKVPRQARAA